MERQEQTIEIGSIGSRYGSLNFTLTNQSDGKIYVNIFTYDAINSRRQPVLVRLDAIQMQELKALMTKVDETIETLQTSRSQKQQQLMDHLQSLTSEQLSGLGIDPAWLT